PSGELIDPYGGEADIRARRIDIRAPDTFREDPLRMLRAAQFAARFGYAPTSRLRTAMARAAPLVRTVSAERIQEEFVKLLSQANRPSVGFEMLRETGVLAELWPELLEGVGVEQNEWHAYDVWHHALASVDAAPPGDLTLRLAALLHDVGKPRTKRGPHFYRHEIVGGDIARAMLDRYRFPHNVSQATEHLVRQHMYVADPGLSDAAVRRFIRRVGPANIERLFALRQADIRGSGLPKRNGSNEAFEARVRSELERKPPFSIRQLALTGDDVIAALVRRGEAPPDFRGDERVGAALHWLFEKVTDEPGRNERSLLLQFLEQYLQTAGLAERETSH
ncbi:MAG: HD domain-containing protein, partial [Candidatus Eremiobacteraeota bacterium]|nr:HD domain-containing protein [Candidatus Eremiobacteraeota bacterium]